MPDRPVSQYRVLLFQPFLRMHILNFGEAVRNFRFVLEQPPTFASTKAFYGKVAQSAEKEFVRNKVTVFTRLRRLFGLLNVRVRFTHHADLLFTYGCLLVTNRPYCVYIENGVTLFNYDAAIARNPLARFFFAILVRLPQCKKLIFMSQAAYTSMLATASFDPATRAVVARKAVQIYPFVRRPAKPTPRKLGSNLKLLFTGIFYVKGGLETLHAFDELRAQDQAVELTIVTPLHYLRAEDKQRIEATPGITLLDAALSREQMEALYRNHDIFLFPTFRDTFGLVLIEALSFGLPIIATDQYATTEMVTDGWNGFVFPDHPLTDYDRTTLKMYGRLYNAKDFYAALFAAQSAGKMRSLEQFLIESITRYLEDPSLLKAHSLHALERYDKRFAESVIRAKIERAFEESVDPPSELVAHRDDSRGPL